MNNRIKKLREQTGMSQRELAAKAEISQAQLQRIEAGTQEVRLLAATRICLALDKTLEEVFPSAKKAISSLRNKNVSLLEASKDEHLSSAFDEAGLDVDPAVWSLKCRLRGGHEGTVPISSPVKDRLWELFERGMSEKSAIDFVVFKTDSRKVAVNVRHLLFWQFLEDPDYSVLKKSSEDQSEPSTRDEDDTDVESPFRGYGNVNVYLADGASLCFDVEPDAEEPIDLLLEQLEIGGDFLDVVSLTDEEGETAFFRTSEIALVEVDLDVVEPDADVNADEDDTEGE